MAAQIAAIADFLAAGGAIQTRLRERSSGDVHDLPAAAPPAGLAAACHAADVIAALEVLERGGVVSRSEEVHPYDSSEYRVTWRVGRESPSMLSPHARRGDAGRREWASSGPGRP